MEKVKFVLLGEEKVRKTSIIAQYIIETFNECIILRGRDRELKYLTIKDKKLELYIWDTSGHESYRVKNKIFIKNIQIALIVYDITDERSFNRLNNWINLINEVNKKEIIFCNSANKSDLFESQIISREKGKKFADNNNCLFF